MGRAYLTVPFARKDEAKIAGARWDKVKRRWYWETDFGSMPESLKQFQTQGAPCVPEPVPRRTEPVPRRTKPTPRKFGPHPRVDLHFDSVADAVSQCMGPFKSPANERSYRSNCGYRPDPVEWYGVPGGADEVKRCLREGWPEGMDRIERFLETINDKLPIAIGVNRTLVRGDMGDHLDVHAMNRGQLDRAWISSKRKLKRSTGLIRICVDICANSGTHASALQWRGVAGAAMARVLEKAKYSVEVAACMALRDYVEKNESSLMTATFVVKPKAGRVDLDRLASTIGLAGFFRIVGFGAAIKSADDMGVDAADNLGWYADASGLIPPDEKITTLWIPQEVCDAETATKWVQNTVKLLQTAG